MQAGNTHTKTNAGGGGNTDVTPPLSPRMHHHPPHLPSQMLTHTHTRRKDSMFVKTYASPTCVRLSRPNLHLSTPTSPHLTPPHPTLPIPRVSCPSTPPPSPLWAETTEVEKPERGETADGVWVGGREVRGGGGAGPREVR